MSDVRSKKSEAGFWKTYSSPAPSLLGDLGLVTLPLWAHLSSKGLEHVIVEAGNHTGPVSEV